MNGSWETREKSNKGLVNSLKSYGIIETSRVYDAMAATDRGHYSVMMNEAYNDNPHPIGYQATISAPHMHAKCLELLSEKLVDGAKVMDVGSGSGYLASCMARMVGPNGKVVGIDYIPELVEMSIKNVKKDDPTLLESGLLELKQGDGWKGDESSAPFDCIHVGAAAETLPEKLVEQLAPGGILVIPVGTFDQNLIMVKKDTQGKITKQNIFGVRYVPLVKSSN
eukprot:TRINITY_DN1250_c0_g1_i2.p1 TRINITY_DN1250_c0_g1~~TRINITY_DN1250_c0_g1_i2.p1  ORF type:complete len:224 (-),score=73.96 TRINITY_DN1250_c0_g1_i2:230-901(-)